MLPPGVTMENIRRRLMTIGSAMIANPVPNDTPAAPTSALDSRAFRNLMGLFPTGVTVVTTRVGEIVHGMTANAIASVSLDPLLLLVSVDRRARMHELIHEAGAFAVNILAHDQEALSTHFAGRRKDGPAPAGLRFVYGLDGADDGGVPTIAGCLGAVRCGAEAEYPGGDHTLLIGRVTELRPGLSGKSPLVFFSGRYRQLAEPDPSAVRAPNPWRNTGLHVYYPEWEPAPEDLRER
jgi:flavin reductase